MIELAITATTTVRCGLGHGYASDVDGPPHVLVGRADQRLGVARSQVRGEEVAGQGKTFQFLGRRAVERRLG
ncbi:hypothetical protein [Nonomuraea jabiensis]|uniref:hypothetical protein n=1 Tax=Nonomuraea jabiensis TaxID=882448 RepID=UPI00368CD81E